MKLLDIVVVFATFMSCTTALSCYSHTCIDSECDTFDRMFQNDRISRFSKKCPFKASGCLHSIRTVTRNRNPSITTITRDCWSPGDHGTLGDCGDKSSSSKSFSVQETECVCRSKLCNGVGEPSSAIKTKGDKVFAFLTVFIILIAKYRIME